MENVNLVENVTEKVQAIIGDSALFLISVKVKPTNNIKVFVDGDTGVTIESVSKINRTLYKQLEEELFPEGDFSLEVSSPGVDEPLLFHRQYKKNVGRKVEVTLADGQVVEGVLKEVTEDAVLLEQSVGKKKEIVTQTIPFEAIKHTIVQISF